MRQSKLIGLALVCALHLPYFSAGQVRAQQTTAVAAVAANRPATKSTLPAASRAAAERITASRLSEFLHVVASDEMEGRDTPSPGLDMTAQYLVSHLTRWGLKPAGDDGTFYQRIKLTRRKVGQGATKVDFDGRALKFGEDYLADRTTGAGEGELVYAGHGWVVKSKKIDAFQGLDVRGRVVIISGGQLPGGLSRTDLKGEPGEDWQDPEFYARKHGAVALVVVPRANDYERWWRVRTASMERGGWEVEKFDAPEERSGLPRIYPSTALLKSLFAGERLSGEEVLKHTNEGTTGAAFALAASKRLKLDVKATQETATTQNVVAVLEGSDPRLKQEYVAVGAHYDHVGKGLPVKGDAIYNGADDDGSGTVAVLSMAEAFAQGPRPKRSIIFVWHAGEEKGLWGSRYFTLFPTVPLDRIVAQINIDMIGRSKQPGDTTPANGSLSGPDEIYVIGSKMMSTELGALSERVNGAYLNLSFNYKYDDPADPNRFFFRSDHFSYAAKGIPIIFYFDGVHEDYHRPSDTVDKIDFRKMEKVTRTVFITASELADAPARPKVDKQLPAMLTER
ncbi:MAG: M28 family peptidase [Acidobacteriota bacterium]|nr:M28 family peptidase [Acidobacteriota bacterium]